MNYLVVARGTNKVLFHEHTVLYGKHTVDENQKLLGPLKKKDLEEVLLLDSETPNLTIEQWSKLDSIAKQYAL